MHIKSVFLIFSSIPLISLALRIAQVPTDSITGKPDALPLWYPFAASTSFSFVQQGTMTKRDMCRTVTPFMGTMKTANKLAGVLYAIDQIQENSVPGNIVEAGVAEGGGVLPALFYLACCGEMRGRMLYLFDTWAGLPPASSEKDDGFQEGQYHISFENFMRNVERYGQVYDKHVAGIEGFKGDAMTDWKEVWSRVQIVKGLFADTMSITLQTNPIGLLMCDGDMYASTKDCMSAAGHLVSKGGAIYNDDYYTFRGCYEAVQEHIQDHTHAPVYLVPQYGQFRLIPESPNASQCIPPVDNAKKSGQCDGQPVEAGLTFQE